MMFSISKPEFSWRYCVWGIYRVRDAQALRVYPLPFIRITIGKINLHLCGVWRAPHDSCHYLHGEGCRKIFVPGKRMDNLP
jgi:hypothetical protein